MSNPFSPYNEPAFVAWKAGVQALPSSEVLIRNADQTEPDGRSMRWIQMSCESSNIHSVEGNVSRIRRQFVLLAEIAGHPVGFCCAITGRTSSDPLFIQLVTVVPSVQKQGVGSALLSAIAHWQPHHDIAMATMDTNLAAYKFNERLARSIGGTIQSVPRNRFRPTDLGITRDEKHRPWLITRPQETN